MITDMTYEVFCNRWYEEAHRFADITIAKWRASLQTPVSPSFDLDEVRSVAVSESLDKTYNTFDPDNESGASVKTYLSGIVHNTILSELKKANTADRRAHGVEKPRKDKQKEERECYSGIIKTGLQNMGNTVVMGPHTYQVPSDRHERKEDLLDRIPGFLQRLAPEDQIIIKFWCEDESTYISQSLEYLGWEDTKRNHDRVSLRFKRAIARLGNMMGSLKDEFLEIESSSDMMKMEGIRQEDIPVTSKTVRRTKTAFYTEKARKLYGNMAGYNAVATVLYKKIYGG